jgi:hypothetical protein
VLALEIAKLVGSPLIEWHINSTTKVLQDFYEYDAVSRLRDIIARCIFPASSSASSLRP